MLLRQSRGELDFYPRPPGGGRPAVGTEQPAFQPISIHALRVEGDLEQKQRLLADSVISIHALRVEGDPRRVRPHLSRCRNFYPRPPGGGRLISGSQPPPRRYFYPRPPGGGRPQIAANCQRIKYFYPRPPGGGRLFRLLVVARNTLFLSTPSGWRATARRHIAFHHVQISIHALRVEGDLRVDRPKF